MDSRDETLTIAVPIVGTAPLVIHPIGGGLRSERVTEGNAGTMPPAARKSTTAAAKSPEAPADVIEIARIDAETIQVPLVGTAPLVVHRFSEKAKRIMLDTMQGKKSPKQPKNPEEEYEGAFYRFGDNLEKYGFPAIGFKAATIGGARYYQGITMTMLRQVFFFRGDGIGPDRVPLVEIHGEPKMREDVVRVGNGGTDLRYRPEFAEWSATLTLTFVKSILTLNSVLSLIDAGGMGVGVGEWRPEKKGDLGTYRIDDTRDIFVLPSR